VTSTSSPGGVNHPDRKGAIIGGTVGGIVGILLMVSVVIWLLIRRRQSKESAQILELAAEQQHFELGGEAKNS
jgi:hypothetical protein